MGKKEKAKKEKGEAEEAPTRRAEAAAPEEEKKPHKPDKEERKRKREERAAEAAAAANAAGGGGDATKSTRDSKRAKIDPPGTVYPILVRGLGGVSVADLRDLFSECGEIKHVRITGQGKAIIDFETRPAAQTAAKLDGTDMDGNKIRVSTLKPTLSPEAEAANKPEAQPVDDEGYSYTVCVNNVPAGTTKEEVAAAAAKHGLVKHVKLDKKREGVAFVEYEPSAKSGARQASKKSIIIGRTICKTVRLKPVPTEEPEVAEKPGVVGGKKNTSTTALVRALPDGVTSEELTAAFQGCGEISTVRLASTAGGNIAFMEFSTKTAFRKALKKKGAPFRGGKLDVSVAKKVVAQAAAGPAKAPKPKPPQCRTVIVKNLPFYRGDNEEKVKQKIKRVFKVALLRPPAPIQRGPAASALHSPPRPARPMAQVAARAQVCGSVKEVRPFMDRANDDASFKGMAYVEFGEPESADAALKAAPPPLPLHACTPREGAARGCRKRRARWGVL
jgi:RNA recognition motif-containing protein